MALSWETLRDLERRYGEAFFVLDLPAFQKSSQRVPGCLSRRLPPHRPSATRTRRTTRRFVCRIADEEGCYAEVVSRMEYDLARRLGVRGERVIFNGPLKTEADLEEALLAGALVNLDSLTELDAVEAIARRRPTRGCAWACAATSLSRRTTLSRFGFWRGTSSATLTLGCVGCPVVRSWGSTATSRADSAASIPMSSARGACSRTVGALFPAARAGVSSTSAASPSAG